MKFNSKELLNQNKFYKEKKVKSRQNTQSELGHYSEKFKTSHNIPPHHKFKSEHFRQGLASIVNQRRCQIGSFASSDSIGQPMASN